MIDSGTQRGREKIDALRQIDDDPVMHRSFDWQDSDSGEVRPALSSEALRRACRVEGAYTLFYYDDVPSAARWYADVVGFEKLLDFGWLALFRLGQQAYLGLVSSDLGSQRPVQGDNRGVLLTISTQDLAAWHQRLFEKGVPGTGEGLQIGCDSLTIEFKVRDPGGYTLEFFEWLEVPHGLG